MGLLKAENLVKTFGGGFLATNKVSIEFDKGVLTSIIGPNGAGKTTLINLLSGSLRPDNGKIFFDDEEITDLHIVRRIKKGICRSFQITNIFPKLTVVENILIPLVTYHKKELKILSKLRQDQELREEAEEILKDIGLSGQGNVKADHLSHGEQRQLEIGIALATHPQIIFLDEPTQGMNKVEKGEIMEYIVRFSREGRATFVIIEHDMDIVFSVSQRIVVLHSGAIIADGSPEEIRNNDLVRNVYLGEEV
jgi:branched-chain amino acid transport system ATP-binding protein